MGGEIITPLAITGAFRLPWQQYSSAAIELRDYEVNTKYLSANEIYKNKYIRSRADHLQFTAFTRNSETSTLMTTNSQTKPNTGSFHNKHPRSMTYGLLHINLNTFKTHHVEAKLSVDRPQT